MPTTYNEKPCEQCMRPEYDHHTSWKIGPAMLACDIYQPPKEDTVPAPTPTPAPGVIPVEETPPVESGWQPEWDRHTHTDLAARLFTLFARDGISYSLSNLEAARKEAERAARISIIWADVFMETLRASRGGAP